MISEKLSTDSRRMLQNGVPQFVGFCRCTPCRQRRGKDRYKLDEPLHWRCTPCRQRRGKAVQSRQVSAYRPGCTPCRQRRGKDVEQTEIKRVVNDAPRAGSAEAKFFVHAIFRAYAPMHPVQAAPRQRYFPSVWKPSSGDAPRAGSAEAKF